MALPHSFNQLGSILALHTHSLCDYLGFHWDAFSPLSKDLHVTCLIGCCKLLPSE